MDAGLVDHILLLDPRRTVMRYSSGDGFLSQHLGMAAVVSGQHPESFGSALVFRLLLQHLVRPSSVDKPQVKNLAAKGVKTRVVNIDGPLDELVKALTGIDLAQLQLITAIKKAGVKRFVPCAFITVAPAGGVFELRDAKEQVYQDIWKQYVPYTIIDIGYWHQISFPTLPSG
ncbi:hypothetical protein B0H14DRAFT_3738323 [Mycena olivaceomarginata]|nr:hypothetical protein B0H14DRAFT_3738323 [Mycena olivaceomarginata]